MFRLIILPVIFVMAATSLAIWVSDGLGLTLVQNAAISTAVFCLTLTLYNHVFVGLTLLRRLGQWSGLAELEKQIERRLITLERKQNEFSQHSKLVARKHKTKKT